MLAAPAATRIIMIIAILAFYFGYKKGKESGRSGVLWALICGFAFLGTQLAVGLGVGIVIALGAGLWGWSETLYDDMALPINLVAIVLSIAVLLLILRYLGRVPDEPTVDAPPPPPVFGPNE
jgi:hypothetical protein